MFVFQFKMVEFIPHTSTDEWKLCGLYWNAFFRGTVHHTALVSRTESKTSYNGVGRDKTEIPRCWAWDTVECHQCNMKHESGSDTTNDSYRHIYW